MEEGTLKKRREEKEGSGKEGGREDDKENEKEGRK
jgi:hypothetical protein